MSNEDAAAEILIHEGDDALGDADHVRGHTDATIAVRVKGVLDVLSHGKVLVRVLRVPGRLFQKRDGCHDLSLHALFLPSV